jgi:hypothetical protein
MPQTCRSQYPSGPAQLGGFLPLAPGVSTVRYPIPERIFDYVSAVRSGASENLHTGGHPKPSGVTYFLARNMICLALLAVLRPG